MTPDNPDTEDGYLLTNESRYAAERFAAFVELFDPSTFRHLEATGIKEGWRCWEVGAGGTSVTDWLADRVGPSGQVLATDLNTTWAAAASSRPNVAVRVHNVASDPPPTPAFDLIHARLVLVHVPERERALANMVEALKPGGYLCIEDADPGLQPLSCPDEVDEGAALANRLRTGFRTLMAGRGADLSYGRTLPRLLRQAGLVEVEADAAFPLGHPACARLETATISLIREQLVSGGIATDEDIDRHLANVAAGRLDLAQPPMIAAWGRRPL
jgi:SAM-dependent methyltransferase